MAQFDENKVINALHPEKAEIGKKYWVADELVHLKDEVKKEKTAYELKNVKKGSFYPFIIDVITGFQFLYPYEEPPKQRMTNIQLMEWLAKGNGLYRYKGAEYLNISLTRLNDDVNNKVDEGLLIKSWDSEEWIEPTVDIYERDCKGGKE